MGDFANPTFGDSVVSLETERLAVREYTIADLDGVVDYVCRNREHLKPYEPARREDYYTAQYWREFLQHKTLHTDSSSQIEFALFEKIAPERIIGKATLSGIIRRAFQACYLGFSLDGDSQGKGMMEEALREAIRFTFEEMNLHRIMANHLLDNDRSARLLSKLGFVREGIAKDYLMIDGMWRDHVLTSLTNPSWKLDLF